MEKPNIDLLFMLYQDKVPEEQKLNLKRSLEKADDKCIDSLMMIKIYNPLTILVLSIFLGMLGIDRFFIGETGLGVCKLLLGWLTLGIWPLVDIFLCYKKAKEKNFENIMMVLR